MAKFSVDQVIRFHSRLNPRLWRHDRLRVEVRLKLLQTAIAFYRFLDLPGLRINDIIVTGSNAAYNYTRLSDIDVHLLVDFSHTSCPVLASDFFNTKKTLWNQTYDTEIHGHPVELYVEDVSDPVNANGIYSLLHNDWLKTPSNTPPQRNDSAVQQKAQAYADEIDGLLAGEPGAKEINNLLKRLYVLRRNGLLAGGEFSTENTAFKVLRNLGYLDKLRDARIKSQERVLSIK
jgi:hypothetical protein